MDHDHDFPLPEGYADPYGREDAGDVALLGRFIGAAFDGCGTCQDAELTLVESDPATCARLVELACTTVAAVLFGGLPPDMTDPELPGATSEEFRRLASAGLDGNHQALYELCGRMQPTERRKAANSAADTLIGYLRVLGGA